MHQLLADAHTSKNITSSYPLAGVVLSCSDSLRAGRYGDRILVWARFSAPVQTQPLIQWVLGFSRGQCGGAMALTTHSYLELRLKEV